MITLGERDQRVAGALLLGAAALQPLWAWTGGVPCLFRALSRVPCPLCGMTTSVCATVTGRMGDAIAANPFGVVLVALAVVLVVTWRRGRVWRVPAWVLWSGLAASWAWQLVRFA
jgi:hypothetical protein